MAVAVQDINRCKTLAFIDLKMQQQRIRAKIDKAVKRVLDHGIYILGPEVEALERKLARHAMVEHCITCSSGTDALLLALMALHVGKGDAVLVPSFTFAATAEMVALIGATPVFVDVNPVSYTIELSSCEQALLLIKKLGLRAAGMISVDLFGLPCDYMSIEPWLAEREMWLICDAAQSYGASYHSRKVGSIGTIAVTSFYPAKPLGCYGDGGAVFTHDDNLAEHIRSLRVHGEYGDKYTNRYVGLNARMDTLQAAILLEKLEIFDEDLCMRAELAQHYNLRLQSWCHVPQIPLGVHSSWAQYTVVLSDDVDREQLREQLLKKGVPTQVYYPVPVHSQQAYRRYPAVNDMSVVQRLAQKVLSLPISISREDHAYVLDVVESALSV